MSWQARGLYRLLQSEANRDGAINLGKFAGSGFRWVAVVFRMRDDDAMAVCDELEADGFIVAQPDGSWLLPHHADQQATITSSSERVKRYREKQRATEPEPEQVQPVTPVTLQPLHETLQGVTLKRKEIKKERNKENKENKERDTRVRAREDVLQDPKAVWLYQALQAVPKFAHLPEEVAEDLLGALGPLGFAMTEAHAQQAVAETQIATETGANEANIRRVLGWKLKDAVSGKPKKQSGGIPHVQGADNVQRDLDKLRAERELEASRQPSGNLTF